MKLLSRQNIAALVAGTFIMAAATTPFIAQASNIQPEQQVKQHTGQHQQHNKQRMSPEQMAQHIATTFSIDQATVLKYNAAGMSFKDIKKAAFLASASGQTIDVVMSHKTSDNNWKDVGSSLGITKEQMHAARNNITANRLNAKIALDKQTTLNLLNQGYHTRDIGMAAQLAKNTNQSIADVLSLKKINNRWSDVATTLGVDQDTFKKDIKELGYGLGHKGGHGGKHEGLHGNQENH